MKRIFQLKTVLILLTVLTVGWLFPVQADAEGETAGWREEDGSLFYDLDSEPLKGCIAEIDGGYYYFRDDGTLLLEDETCMVSDENGETGWIRAGWDNLLIAGDWYIDDSADPAESYYYGENFAAICGPAMVDDVFYLFDNDTGLLLANRKVLINETWWESDAHGVLSPLPEEQGTEDTQSGWVTGENGKQYYYLDGVRLSGGFFEIDGRYRFFHDDGSLAKSENLYLDSHWVRFDEEGCVIPDSAEKNADSPDQVQENPADNGEPQNPAEPAQHPTDGWQTINGEKYYYRDQKPIPAGRHYIDWAEYYFDENGRLLHDCILDDRILDSDGTVVQGGLVSFGDRQYYVNPTTHLIEKNTEVSIDSILYTADADGRVQKKPLPSEPGMEAAADSRPDNVSADSDLLYSSDSDPDEGYVPMNEEDPREQEELPSSGSIRYSDNYLSNESTAKTAPTPGINGTDNPASGILLWRDGMWTEIHGSAEKPIGIHFYGKDAAILDNGTVLRDAFVYSSEGVYGFDRYGNALPEGFAARYGKHFYVISPDPNAEMLVLLMS